MKQMSIRALSLIAFTVVFVIGIFSLTYLSMTRGDDWTSFPANRHIYKDGVMVNAGDITDRFGTVLATTENGQRIFNDDYYTRLRDAVLKQVL